MQMGYWDGNRFVIPGLPQATPPSVTQPPQGIIPQAAHVQSPVQPIRSGNNGSLFSGDDDGTAGGMPGPMAAPLDPAFARDSIINVSPHAAGAMMALPGGSVVGGLLGGHNLNQVDLGLKSMGFNKGLSLSDALDILNPFSDTTAQGFLNSRMDNEAQDSGGHPGGSSKEGGVNTGGFASWGGYDGAQMAAAAQQAMNSNDADNPQDNGGGAPDGSDGHNDDPTGGGAEGLGWAEGGFVTKDRLVGPDPEGPDDGYGGLDEGEAVIPTKMVDRYGEDVMQALIDGDIDPKRLRALL